MKPGSLAALGALFDTSTVEVDQTVSNAARLTKVVGTVAASDAVDAGVLNAVVEVDLVALCRLPSQPHVTLVPRAVAQRLPVKVRVVGPFRGIARVLVGPHAGNVLAAEQIAVRAVEPQLVADDRAA